MRGRKKSIRPCQDINPVAAVCDRRSNESVAVFFSGVTLHGPCFPAFLIPEIPIPEPLASTTLTNMTGQATHAKSVLT